MTQPDILFQYYTTTANTDTSEAELAFQAEENGTTMVVSLFAASSAGGNSNIYRIHHCGPDEEPNPANIIIYGKSTATSTLPNATQNIKIILNTGDKLFCQLHSGNGITVTGYGLRPAQRDMNTAFNDLANTTLSDSMSASIGQDLYPRPTSPVSY